MNLAKVILVISKITSRDYCWIICKEFQGLISKGSVPPALQYRWLISSKLEEWIVDDFISTKSLLAENVLFARFNVLAVRSDRSTYYNNISSW